MFSDAEGGDPRTETEKGGNWEKEVVICVHSIELMALRGSNKLNHK